MQNNKPVILHCIDSLGRGGAEILLKNTLPLLHDYEHVICYLHPPDDLVSSFQNYTVYCLHFTSKITFFKARKKLRQIIDEHRVSIIHTHLFYATLLARLSSPKKIKFLFTIHNLLSKDAFEVNRLSLFAERMTYKKNQVVIGVSREVLNDYGRHVGIKGSSFVLYNYVDQRFFDLKYDYESQFAEDFKLVAVGNLRRQKNYFLLLDAFALLKDLPIRLDIYGSGDLEKPLQERINADGVRVRLMGRTDDVSKILLNYHAYIMASVFEGFGIAPMEAMAAGMPVLLSNLNVFKELAEDIPGYFDPNDPVSIAGAIKFAFNNWPLIKERAKKGKDLVYKKASREIYFKKLGEIYNSVGVN